MIHEAARAERARLYLAALKDDWKSVQDMLKVENIAGNTALSYAAAAGNVNIAKAILEKIETCQS